VAPGNVELRWFFFSGLRVFVASSLARRGEAGAWSFGGGSVQVLTLAGVPRAESSSEWARDGLERHLRRIHIMSTSNDIL
jgi:hypothetical protein